MSYQRDTLVAELRARGITYLAPSDASSTETISSAEDLIMALLNQPDPRLQLALVPLFIRHPDLAQCVPALINNVSPAHSLELQTFYMAAVYLQRLWLTRLGFYLDSITLLPDLYSQWLNLPPADERFGKAGLYALAEAWTARSPYPFNRLASLNKVMDLFFEQLKMEHPYLKEGLSLNIEEVSPADFIPLPSGYKERSQFIGRYGQLDVFHFDLYSTALSKIARGTEEDIADVLSLLQTGRLEMPTLTQYFNEILPHFATASLERDPVEFKRKFEALTEMWRNIQKDC